MKRRIALLAAACVAVMALGGCQKVNEAPTAPAVTQGEADAAKEEPAGKKAEEGKGVNKVAFPEARGRRPGGYRIPGD